MGLLVLLIILLHHDPYYSKMFDNMMYMHIILYVRQLQCSQPHMLPHIYVQVTTSVDWMLHSLCLLYMKIFVPYKWIRRLYIFSKNLNNLLWYFRRIYHHFPWNGMHNTTYHLDVRQLPVFYGLYLLEIVLRLARERERELEWKKWDKNSIKSLSCFVNSNQLLFFVALTRAK